MRCRHGPICFSFALLDKSWLCAGLPFWGGRRQRKGGRQGGAIFILGLMSFNRIDRGFFLPSNEGVMRKLANRLKTRKRGALPAFWL
jgi:hypothetical protein